jgi:quercetin dioxygenase-like cupin family protein
MRKAVFADIMGPVEKLQVLNTPVLVLTDSADTAGRYEIFEVTEAAGGAVPTHRHPWDEDYYVLEGKLNITVDGVARNYGVGESLRVAGGTTHAFEVPEGGARFLMIASPGGLAALFRALDEALRSGRLTEAELGRLASAHQLEAL